MILVKKSIKITSTELILLGSQTSIRSTGSSDAYERQDTQ